MHLPHDPVILFDGVCHLCNSTIGFVIRRDPLARVHFLPIQSPQGCEIYRSQGLNPDQPSTILWVSEGQVLTRSDAIMAIGRQLGFPWSLVVVGRVLPRRTRDWLYDFIATRRYRWFGRSNACLVPTPEIRARFLK